MNSDLKVLLQYTGDSICNVFDQLIKGNWIDDHGHEVKMNKEMIELQTVLKEIGEFRTKYLGYSEWGQNNE